MMAAVERIDKLIELLRLGLGNRGLAGCKIHEAQFLATPKRRTEQRKWRRGRLDHQVHEHLPDERQDAKLRVICPPRNGNVQIDSTVAVLEQRNGQFTGN